MINILALILTIPFSVEGVGSVSGTISSGASPISDARVTLFTKSLTVFLETRSDNNGEYFFDPQSKGQHLLGVAAVGYDYEQVMADVSATPLDVDFQLEAESHQGSWDIIGNTLPELFDSTDIAFLLEDGTVFYCHDTVDPIRFDPVTGEKTFPAGAAVEQGCMNGTLLASGELMMVGGQTPSDPGSFTNAIPWVKAYNPITDSWRWMEFLQHKPGRWYPGLTRLADGSVLVMGGGQAPDASRTDTAERFVLETETWEYTGSMVDPVEFPPSALLYTGDVLATWSQPQLYDVITGIWSVTGNFTQPNRGWPGHSDHSIVVLGDGDVLAVGIRGASLGYNVMVERYDPDTATWSAGSSPDLVRNQCEVVQLPDGRILVAGGETEEPNPPVDDILGIVRWCDLYSPDSDSWHRVDSMIWHREYHAVTLLIPDGRVITTGGTYIKFQVGPSSADIEAFSPPYLFRGVRPEITSISTTTPQRGETISLNIAPTTQLTSVVLMGSDTTTHWVSAGIPRRLVLPITQKGSTATATLPCDPNVIPLGRYMVFAMADDIPSIARIVEVVQGNAADLNGDGVVDTLDLLLLFAQWGTCDNPPPAGCPADINCDGMVNVQDLLALFANWG
ncbi:MAG: DUF1929 domain-containing protein [Planctomycetes bacterium]|nr:DUF1929 domain-containing protein [Planctomycetota bacterium]